MNRSILISLVLVGALGVARAEYVQLTSVMDLHTMGTDADGLDLDNAFISIYPPKAGPAGQFFKMRARESNLEVPFVAGPWKGGKAVFEYPRDLSYMEVSIYDKRGERQRLYSVRSKPYESGRAGSSGGEAPKKTGVSIGLAMAPSGVPSAEPPADQYTPYKTSAYQPAPAAQQVPTAVGSEAPSDEEPNVAVTPLPRRESGPVVLPTPAPAAQPVDEKAARRAREAQRRAQRQAYDKMKTSQDVAKDVFKQDEVIDKTTPKTVDENPAPLLDPRVRKLAATPVVKAAPVVVVNEHVMDVNDPEMGVPQGNSGDKFSGGRFGRHREYERRVVYGKRPSSPVKGYDYYVDEVDRKKEVHSLYFYRHEASGKNKLVALQKYENVKFLSNYDISDDGPAKISTY